MNSRESVQESYRERLLKLRPDQRSYLLQKLGVSHDSAPSDEACAGKLTACIIPGQDSPIESRELKQFAKQHLPDYMVPTDFRVVEDFPRMSGGKIDRRALNDYVWNVCDADGEESDEFIAPRNEKEELLAGIWMEVLGLDQVSVHDDFYEIGGDSLLSIRILARANKAGLGISPDDFFSYPTIAEQAGLVAAESKQAEPLAVVIEAELSPIQHWFFERVRVRPEHWNQSMCLTLSPQLDYLSLQTAVRKLLSHHDMLRASFIRDEQGWRQVIGELTENLPVRRVDLSQLSEREIQERLVLEASQANRELQLDQGSLIQFVFLETPPTQENRLLLIIHHLLVDAESWRIVLADLEQLWLGSSCGASTENLVESPSFLQWCNRVAEYTNAGNIESEIAYWQSLSNSNACAIPIDYDSQGKSLANTNGTVAIHSVSLSTDETRSLLDSLIKTYHSEISDALLSALFCAIRAWSGQEALLVDVEGHGREYLFDDMDISRTVGWFTTVYPVLLSPKPSERAVDLLVNIKETLRMVPGRGIGHGMLKYLGDNSSASSALKTQAPARVCFNYLGQVDKLRVHTGQIVIERENIGETRYPGEERAYQLELNTRIADEKLEVNIIFSEELHSSLTIENLANNYLDYLRTLISESLQSDSEIFTPSDFPLADLDQGELDAIAGILTDIDKHSD